MLRLLYTLAIRLYSILAFAYSPFNEKARLWHNGRKEILQKLKKAFSSNTSPVVWIHCSSLGEFEQGRPLIEEIRSQFPGIKILLTFFSPSGYEIKKSYSSADWVFYLPLDTRSNAKEFLEIVKPKMAVFIKYDFWFNFLASLKSKNIPVYLVSGIFRPSQHFFKWYGAWFRNSLGAFTYFFLQNEQSLKLLNGAGFKNCGIAGDTRFDRVSKVASEPQEIEKAKKFAGDSEVIVCGSTWPEDENLLSEFLKQKEIDERIKLLVAPHNINSSFLDKSLRTFSDFKVCRFSDSSEQELKKSRILLIDNIGMLSSLYRYGNYAYIGGGFGNGIHNTLEAAVYGLPIFFGPDFHRFAEAKEMIALGSAFSINNSSDLVKVFLPCYLNPELRKKTGLISSGYVRQRTGALKKIISFLEPELKKISPD